MTTVADHGLRLPLAANILLQARRIVETGLPSSRAEHLCYLRAPRPARVYEPNLMPRRSVVADNVQYITMSEEGVHTVYISLPGHPGRGAPGCVKKVIRLDSVLTDHDLPMLNLDFDENNKLIGLEVLV